MFQSQLSNIKRKITEQLEYLLSKDNLSTDKYLRDLAESSGHVNIEALAKHIRFKNLSHCPDVIFATVKERPDKFDVDIEGHRVKSLNYISAISKCYLALRGPPKYTTAIEIKELFPEGIRKKIVKTEFMNNDLWYIYFEEDDLAQQSIAYISTVGANLKDHALTARVKYLSDYKDPPASACSLQTPGSVPRLTRFYPQQQSPSFRPPLQSNYHSPDSYVSGSADDNGNNVKLTQVKSHLPQLYQPVTFESHADGNHNNNEQYEPGQVNDSSQNITQIVRSKNYEEPGTPNSFAQSNLVVDSTVIGATANSHNYSSSPVEFYPSNHFVPRRLNFVFKPPSPAAAHLLLQQQQHEQQSSYNVPEAAAGDNNHNFGKPVLCQMPSSSNHLPVTYVPVQHYHQQQQYFIAGELVAQPHANLVQLPALNSGQYPLADNIPVPVPNPIPLAALSNYAQQKQQLPIFQVAPSSNSNVTPVLAVSQSEGSACNNIMSWNGNINSVSTINLGQRPTSVVINQPTSRFTLPVSTGPAPAQVPIQYYSPFADGIGETYHSHNNGLLPTPGTGTGIRSCPGQGLDYRMKYEPNQRPKMQHMTDFSSRNASFDDRHLHPSRQPSQNRNADFDNSAYSNSKYSNSKYSNSKYSNSRQKKFSWRSSNGPYSENDSERSSGVPAAHQKWKNCNGQQESIRRRNSLNGAYNKTPNYNYSNRNGKRQQWKKSESEFETSNEEHSNSSKESQSAQARRNYKWSEEAQKGNGNSFVGHRILLRRPKTLADHSAPDPPSIGGMGNNSEIEIDTSVESQLDKYVISGSGSLDEIDEKAINATDVGYSDKRELDHDRIQHRKEPEAKIIHRLRQIPQTTLNPEAPDWMPVVVQDLPLPVPDQGNVAQSLKPSKFVHHSSSEALFEIPSSKVERTFLFPCDLEFSFQMESSIDDLEIAGTIPNVSGKCQPPGESESEKISTMEEEFNNKCNLGIDVKEIKGCEGMENEMTDKLNETEALPTQGSAIPVVVSVRSLYEHAYDSNNSEFHPRDNNLNCQSSGGKKKKRKSKSARKAASVSSKSSNGDGDHYQYIPINFSPEVRTNSSANTSVLIICGSNSDDDNIGEKPACENINETGTLGIEGGVEASVTEVDISDAECGATNFQTEVQGGADLQAESEDCQSSKENLAISSPVAAEGKKMSYAAVAKISATIVGDYDKHIPDPGSSRDLSLKFISSCDSVTENGDIDKAVEILHGGHEPLVFSSLPAVVLSRNKIMNGTTGPVLNGFNSKHVNSMHGQAQNGGVSRENRGGYKRSSSNYRGRGGGVGGHRRS